MDFRKIVKKASPAIIFALGIGVGVAIVNAKYNKILSGCEVYAWDCWEDGITAKEFFELLTPEMRVVPKCPTQICID